MLPICPQGDDIADLAVLDALRERLAGPAVADHQSHADLQVLLDRLVGQRQHLAGGRAIDGGRLLHEDVDALFDGVAKMRPAKRRRRAQDRHVARLKAIDGVAIGVEAEELPVLGGNGKLLAQVPLEVPAALLPSAGKISAIAASFTGPPLVATACVTASVPRLPQPIKANRIVLSSAACTWGITTPAKAAAPATRPVFFKKLTTCGAGLLDGHVAAPRGYKTVGGRSDGTLNGIVLMHVATGPLPGHFGCDKIENLRHDCR